MPKFTQGKWHADDMCQYIFSRDEQMMIAQIRGWGRLTGKGTGGMGLSDEEAYEIQKANARLIAAAPEMYNWIKYFLQHAGITANNGVADECRLHGDIREAVALIARINGEEAHAES